MYVNKQYNSMYVNKQYIPMHVNKQYISIQKGTLVGKNIRGTQDNKRNVYLYYFHIKFHIDFRQDDLIANSYTNTEIRKCNG